jgi:hypothetical protein
MELLRVPMEELLCQAVMGWIPILECLLSGVRSCLQLYPIMSDIK